MQPIFIHIHDANTFKHAPLYSPSPPPPINRILPPPLDRRRPPHLLRPPSRPTSPKRTQLLRPSAKHPDRIPALLGRDINRVLMARVVSEQIQDILHTQFPHRLLPFNGRLREGTLLLL